ncbi:MAG: HEAT repeat domain-containing protein [bacterium]
MKKWKKIVLWIAGGIVVLMSILIIYVADILFYIFPRKDTEKIRKILVEDFKRETSWQRHHCTPPIIWPSPFHEPKLKRMGKSILPVLIEIIEDEKEDKWVRDFASGPFGNWEESKKYVPRLIKILKEGDETGRISAVTALYSIGLKYEDKRVIVPLIEASFWDKDINVRHIAYVWYDISKKKPELFKGNHKTVKLLIEYLLTEKIAHGTRRGVTDALGNINDKKAIGPLKEILKRKDEHPHVKKAAEEALEKILNKGDE